MNRKLDDMGRIVIPKEMRKVLDIENGDSVDFELLDGTIVISKHDNNPSDKEKLHRAYETTTEFEKWLEGNEIVARAVVLDFVTQIQKDLRGE